VTQPTYPLSFWAFYPPPFSPGDPANLSFILFGILSSSILSRWHNQLILYLFGHSILLHSLQVTQPTYPLSFWASYPPPFSPGDTANLSFIFLGILSSPILSRWHS
jgi:hypothetical protein